MSETAALSTYKCTPRQARQFIEQCLRRGVVPFLQSSPGMGKSAIVRSIAEEYALELRDHRLSTSAPEDLSGLPQFKDGKATFVPFDLFPTADMKVPEGKQGWLLFLDEFNSASKAVQAAAYKLVLDRAVGQHRLHDKVVIVCAGNLATDRAIVNPLGTAMQSRLVHLEMETNFDQFLEDVMIPQKWDNRIIAYLSYKPSQLHDFRPEHQDKTFCCPRTWEFLSRLIKDIPNDKMDDYAPLFAGTITSGVALDFIQFTKVYAGLPRFQSIVQDPLGTQVPNDPATRYATVTHILDHIDEATFQPVIDYLERFPAEFRVLFFRALKIQKPELEKQPGYAKALVSISRYLHD